MTISYDAVAHERPFAASSPPRSARSIAADLLTLTKPRITLMVGITMLGGIWLAAKRGGLVGLVGEPGTGSPSPSGLTSSGLGSTPAELAAAVLGTVLVVGSANALNMYLERDTDRLMARTKDRPLPAGRLSASLALWFGLGLGAVSVPLLTLAVNPVTGLLAAFALVSYVAVYTPLKRKSTLSLLVGAVPGAIPPLLGWTAVTARIQWPGILLFGILFLWQVPHFLAIATFRRDDYARAGLKVLPVERGDRVTRLHIVGYLIALVATSLALVATGVGGRFYCGAATALGAAFLGFGVWGLRASAGVRWARGLFAVSIVYLVLLFSALVLSP